MSNEILHITSEDELRAATGTYARSLYSLRPGSQSLELVLGEGTFRGVHLSLSDTAGAGAVDLILRGQPGRTILDGCAIYLGGPRVEVRDLIVTGSPPPQSFAMHLEGRSQVRLERVAFVDQDVDRTNSGHVALAGVLRVETAGSAAAALSDVWFVDNRMSGGAPLLAAVAMGTDHRFASFDMDRVVMVGNTGGPAVSARVETAIQLRDAIVAHRPGSAWAALHGIGAQVRIDETVLVCEGASQLIDRTTPGGAAPCRDSLVLEAVEILERDGWTEGDRLAPLLEPEASVVGRALEAARRGGVIDRAVILDRLVDH